MRVGPIRSKQSYYFEHEEIKKPLPLPEILSPLKAPKQRESRKLSYKGYLNLLFVPVIIYKDILSYSEFNSIIIINNIFEFKVLLV